MANMSTNHLGEIEFSCLCFHNYSAHSMYPVNQITAILHKRSAIGANFVPIVILIGLKNCVVCVYRKKRNGMEGRTRRPSLP